MSASPQALVKIFAMFSPGSVLGVTEDVDINDSLGGMAVRIQKGCAAREPQRLTPHILPPCSST